MPALNRAQGWGLGLPARVSVVLGSTYATSGRDIQAMSGIAGSTQPSPATT
jgi:hypothetical protein